MGEASRAERGVPELCDKTVGATVAFPRFSALRSAGVLAMISAHLNTVHTDCGP